MNYDDMDDEDLNNAVASSLGKEVVANGPRGTLCQREKWRDYCNNPSDAWPIIVENSIIIHPKPIRFIGRPNAGTQGGEKVFVSDNAYLLRAAMIVFLKMKDAENE